MRINERMKRALSILLCVMMLVQYVPTHAFAATTDNLCDHHTEHTAECGYVEAAEGSPCTHIHDEACGYAEPIGEVLCACTETDDTGALVHTEGCGYVAPVAGSDCTHAHDEVCGYVAAVEAQECHYECAECAAAAASEQPSEESSDPAPVCTCGTDDPAIHATTCGVYVAPENPVCSCAEACGVETQNFWCDVCGFDYSKCTGTDTAVVYADEDYTYDEATNTYTVYTADGLFAVAELVNDGAYSANITLAADIVLNENLANNVTVAEDGTVSADASVRKWTPMGENDKGEHYGTFDGCNHTITGLYCVSTGYGNTGLISALAEGATVKNVKIHDFCLESSGGAVVGYNRGEVIGCSISGTGILGWTTGYRFVGGVVGYNDDTVKDCTSSAALTFRGMGYFGGIVGQNMTSQATIIGCSNSGTITAAGYSDMKVGCILGGDMGTVKDCYNTGSIRATVEDGFVYVGGIVGLTNDTVTGCYNTGTVSGDATGDSSYAYVGGIAGLVQNTVSGCYNTGAVSGKAMAESAETYVGGIAGSTYGNVSGCYNTAAVSGDATFEGTCAYVGGIVGNADGTVTGCHNTGTISVTADASSFARVGGITAVLNGTASNCYNSGSLVGDGRENCYVGGIAVECYNGGASNCYNIGSIDSGGYSGGIVATASGIFADCYYLDTCVKSGSTEQSSANGITEKTSDQFASGEVAYALNGDQSTITFKQTLGTDAAPNFTGGTVYQVSVTCMENAVVYANSQDTLAHNYVNNTCTLCGISIMEGYGPDSDDSEFGDVSGTAITSTNPSAGTSWSDETGTGNLIFRWGAGDALDVTAVTSDETVAYEKTTVQPHLADAHRMQFPLAVSYEEGTPVIAARGFDEYFHGDFVTGGTGSVANVFTQTASGDPGFLSGDMLMYGEAEYTNGTASVEFKHIPAVFRFVITNTHGEALTLNSVTLRVVDADGTPVAAASKACEITVEAGYGYQESFSGYDTYDAVTTNITGGTLEPGQSYIAYALALPIGEAESGAFNEAAFKDKTIQVTVTTSEGVCIAFELAADDLASANPGNDCNWVGGKSYTMRMGTRCADGCTFDATGNCTVCGYQCDHDGAEYKDNGDGTHDKVCGVCGYVEVDNEAHTPAEDATYTNNGNGTHSSTCAVCGNITEEHAFDENGNCVCGINLFAVSGSTLTIDGTLGGKTEATEEDITVLVNKIKECVDNGITTIIVTGSEPAMIDMGNYTTTAIGEAIYRLSGSDDYDENNPYNGKIDLILQDVTEIVDQEFYSAWALNSITLPKVTTIGDMAFQGCDHLTKLTFGSVLTTIDEHDGLMFWVGEKVDGCDLFLNCGQMNSQYVPDLATNTWTILHTNEFKSITLTHTEGTAATCIAQAVCSVCGESYGEVGGHTPAEDAAYTDNGDGTHSYTCTDCKETVAEDHSGGTATCTTLAVCTVCGVSYGDVDTTNHDETVAFDSNGFCPNGCYEPATDSNADGVYEISNAGQLYWFAQQVNSGETTINAILMNDIVINSQVLDADGNLISDTSGLRQWTPIGHYNSNTDNLGFAGTFDGNGKTISGLYHYGDTARYAGLFGYSAGTIRGLTIADTYIHTTHSDGRAGSVIGRNNGTVSGCHGAGFVSGYRQIGGIAGWNSGAIENCSNSGTVKGNNTVGGIAGIVSDGTINNCYNVGSVKAESSVGGVVGWIQNTANISNCYSAGTVEGSSQAGGVIGYVLNNPSTNATITNCYHDNTVCGYAPVGVNGGSNASATLTKVEGKTTEAFASGEVTWLLNGESAEGIWKQTIGTDTYPGFTGDTVYCGYSNGCFEDAKFYTNNPEEATERADHTFDNGVCTVCGAYEPAADSDADGYYEIYNAGNLFWFAQKVNSGENTINAKLMADIDLENCAWTPMGTHDDTNSAKNCHFKGTFDGNYHIVKNLSVTVEDNCEAGFFGRAEGATIQNFGIVKARVEGKGGYRVGAIGGELHNCTVTNVFSAGEITLITDNAQKGGIAGESHSSTLNGCFTTYSNLTAAANVTVTNCYYLAEEASSASAGMNMSANKFTSGELTWLLNGESAEGIWKQTLDTDTYPSFTGRTVYHGNCGGGVPYSNVAEETMNHTYTTENGYRCSNTLLSGGICNIYESAAQNVDGYYEIYNASQLYWFAEQVNGGEKSINAVLMNDIDLTNHTWTPIGVTAMGESVTDGYTGTFDGQGHVISNITFAAPTSAMAAGIFGTVQSGGTVKNLGVENLTFDNNDYDHRAAGIAGQLLADSTISDCYVINSTVKASSRVVGGIVGMNKGTVKNCYTCNMTLAGYNNRFGGISGDYSGGKLENCYTDYSALASSEAGTTTNCEAGVSAERFASGEIAYALGNGWGQTIGTDGCPVFGGATVYQVANIGCPAQGEYVYSNVNEAVAAAHKYTNGFCACGEYEEAVQNADGYYVIDNAGKLFWFAELVNGGNNTINAVLTADIDLENRNWTPIGTQNESVSPNVKVPYMGIFDGQCHVIKNLSIHVIDGREAGLFGRAQDATLSNFGVVDATVVSDPVNGTGYRAGIVAGELHRCTVANVYSAGNLTVTTTHAQAGGIAGECADSTLTNCFTTYGCLTASNAALPAAVTNCYYLAESENTGSCGDYKTADQFASGEVAWLLNGSTDQGDLVWYQNIGMDAYPKFEGLVVNYNTDSDTYHNGNTVSVSISWTEMSFTYTAGEWDPETHTYTGSWTADDGAARLTVKNVGAANVPVRFTFAGTMGEVTGQFDVEKAALAPGRAATTTLTVSGDPRKSGFVDAQIGTVTVSLGSSGWTTGEKVTFYAKDGKDYPSTVAEVTDSKLVLVSDNHKTKKINGRQCNDDVVLSLLTSVDARYPTSGEAAWKTHIEPWGKTLPGMYTDASDWRWSHYYGTPCYGGDTLHIYFYDSNSEWIHRETGVKRFWYNQNTASKSSLTVYYRYVWDVEFAE